MPEFTRQELYDLVWSEPMKTLAARFDISDVGLAKACRGANIPVPERGYWAKLKSGKPTTKGKLPPRDIGETDRVTFAAKNNARRDPITLDGPEPVMPAFPDDMAEIQGRVATLVGKVAVPRQLDKAHPAITKLLEADAVRAKAYSASSYFWEKPLFASNFEKRRLRVLNALMLSLQRAGARPSLSGKEGRDIGLVVGSQHFSLTLDRQGAPRDYRYVTSRLENGSDILELGIPDGSDTRKFRIVWRDSAENPLERQLTEAVIELIVEGERRYRANALNYYNWIMKRREELREEVRQRQEAVRKANEERRIQREKERVDGLLHQAMELRKANDIRNFIQAIMSEKQSGAIDPSLLAEWMSWASAEADRIDPIKNGRLIAPMNDTRREPDPVTENDLDHRLW
jgi:hypothetical protein